MTTTRRSTAGRRSSLLALTGAGALVAPLATIGDAAATTDPVTADPGSATESPVLATFGSGLGSGSAIGPDGALYVTDGNAGTVERVDLTTGDVTTVGEGLPPQVLGIGGAIDVAFVDETAYVLVTMVGGDIVEGDHIGDDPVGIYRLDDDGTFSVVADLGTWSAEHPPATDYFITSGVQYAMEPYGEGFLVSDGHHNRVLDVGLDGAIAEMMTFGNEVPTGLEVAGDDVYLGLAGPLPHLPADGRVVAWSAAPGDPVPTASGASMIVDVELAGGQLFALSQGEWDGVQEGSPAKPDTGRIVAVHDDGTMTPVTDAAGYEVVLDRPTSLELVGTTGYVVTLPGDVVIVEDIVEDVGAGETPATS